MSATPLALGNTNYDLVTALQNERTVAAVTARAGGTKALATPLTASNNAITVCATAADSVVLPAATAGLSVFVANDGAAAAQVFGVGTDTIDGVNTATGVVLTNAKRCTYTCVVAGNWISNMGVKSA